MRPLRVLMVLLLIGAGLGASALLISKEARSLRGFPLFHVSPSTTVMPGRPRTKPSGGSERRRPRRASGRRPAPRRPAPKRAAANPVPARQRHSGGGLSHVSGLHAVLIAGLEIAAGVLLLGLLLGVFALRRFRRRSRREYALYELHLSAHDEAKPQDLEDMVESIANIVRVFPAERARDGQPYFALELICGEAQQGMEWSINVRCEPRSARALDGAIAAAYPDVRVGRRHSETPRPRVGALRVPGCVMRFRKERSFVYPLLAAGEELASPPLEQIARAQIELGEASIVRFQLTPTPSFFEEYARRLYKRHENKLVRQERWGLPEGGLWSTLNRAEMSNAERTQNRSLFWLETVIAADTMKACKTVAAAVQSRRGENRLHRRWMIVRQGLYRRRFPRALGPVVPSFRSLVSAAEVAHLLALPTARMKGVPVRRLMLPRIPAPPELERTARLAAVGGVRTPALAAIAGASSATVVQQQAPSASDPPGLYPVLRAENAQVAIRPQDRKYGALLVGGQGTGKTSALLALYRSDILDPDAAPIVADPKTEIALLCLAHTPPDCAKRVWYLDLGRPAFGMNPLLRTRERPLALEAAEIAENVVAALLDVYEDQIFASSRRYLYHAVIGALALAESEQRRPTFEDMQSLLEPGGQELRNRAGQACADIPDLDLSAHFLRVELPDELRLASSQTTVRMDAPRNKISTLLQAAPIRRFFHHPTNVSIRQIIEARDILIIDCAQGQVGDDNVKPMLMFMMRMLHRQLQRQVRLPESERPRVPVIIDEAHYVADTENFVDQIATHRRAGLEMACGIQYFAQLGSGSKHSEKIRKGVLNLLQSRFLFRMGDVEDAQEATRIAMAVYATMIRDDPDSRARMKVTPEQLLNFPNHFCLASWIAHGTRAPSFTGETYPLPDYDPLWAERHLALQSQRTGPYPETLDAAFDDAAEASAATNGDGREPADGTASVAPQREYLSVPYEEKDAAKRLGARWDPDAQHWYIPAGHDPEPFARWRTSTQEDDPRPDTDASGSPSGNGHHPTSAGETAKSSLPPKAAPRRESRKRDIPPPAVRRRESPRREVRVDYEPPPQPPRLDDSPVRRVVGRRVPGAAPGDHAPPAPDSLRELAFLDRINEVGGAEQHQGAASLPRLYEDDYAILALLDRAGLVPRALVGRACLPGRTANAVTSRLVKLHRHGLIAQHSVGIREHTRGDGKLPLLHSLTRRGMEVAQTREPPAISRKREWRATGQGRALRLAHDLHALAWSIELHRLIGEVATDHWRTPRYATGRYPVPQVGSGRSRHPITLNEVPVAYKQAIIDLEQKAFTEIKPDLSLELRIPSPELNFDLLVELDLTSRPSYNHDKLLAYDAFLCGWSLAHPRYQTQGTRPAVVFVCADARAALALAQEADEAMTGRIGVMGTGPEHWYHAGRDHVFFAIEADIHHGDLSALALPVRPPGLRERLTGTRDLELERVALLPGTLIKPKHSRA